MCSLTDGASIRRCAVPAIIALLFLASASIKVADFPRFLDQVAGYRVVSRGLSAPLGVLVIIVEFALVFGLLRQSNTRSVLSDVTLSYSDSMCR